MKQESWILCSACEQDSVSEVQALDITPTDTVICQTGSGCRILNALVYNPKYLITVDPRPHHNYLLDLKLAAIRYLSYPTLLQFLGVEDSPNRWNIFCLIEDKISLKTKSYFQANRWVIEKGILFWRQPELLSIRFVALLIRLLYGSAFKHICCPLTSQDQISADKTHISNRRWRCLIRMASSFFMLRFILNTPQYFLDRNIANQALDKFNYTLIHHLLQEPHWYLFMFPSKCSKKNSLPHFLREENYLAIRKATSQVEIVTANLINYIKQQPAESINKYLFSDLSNFIEQQAFNNLMHEIVRTSTHKGQLCYRSFLIQQHIPSDLQALIKPNNLMNSFFNKEYSAFYSTFEFAEIKP